VVAISANSLAGFVSIARSGRARLAHRMHVSRAGSSRVLPASNHRKGTAVTRASLLAFAAVAAAPVLLVDALVLTKTAQADVIHVGGSASVRIGGGIRVRTPRVHWRPHRYHYGPRRGAVIYYGGGYYDYRWAAPPPPPPPCDCAPGVPSYYPPAAPVPVVVAQPAPPRLARLGLGGFVGGTDVDGEGEADDAGLFARLRLTRGLILEGEIAHSELGDDREENRVGGSLIYEFGAANRWAPYILGGIGVSVREDEYGVEEEYGRGYGEIGIGLRWALTERFHLAADIRAGAAGTIEEDDWDEDDAVRSAAFQPRPDDDEAVEYTRARLSAVIYF
jgi:hypothetical protein